MKKNCIVVLTRGYEDISKYKLLVHRNKCIAQNFYLNIVDKENYDIIIFHEGNITQQHKIYIQKQTPRLPLKFITVSFMHNVPCNNNLCPPTVLSEYFTNGYKNMCYFWSVNFFKYLIDYDYVIRIDEDCFLQSIPLDIIDKYKQNNIFFSSPYFQGDDDADVVVGMNAFFTNILINNNLTKKIDQVKNPYTNFMIVNIPFFVNNNLIRDIHNKLTQSRCIFSNRWGDLPIWGYILSWFIDKQYYIEETSISYWHDSHRSEIN